MRIKNAGWHVVYLPAMTIVHHAGKAGFSVRVAAQDAYARRQYLSKNAGRVERFLCMTGLCLGYVVRAVTPESVGEASSARRRAARAALLTLVGLRPPPFGEPPTQAVALRTAEVATRTP